MSFDADTTACAALTQKSDPERFAATMALQVAARMRLFPLWGFNIEVARAPWVTKEPLIAQMRLQWWQDALEEIATAQTPRRHKVVTPLASVLSPKLAEALQEVVEARRLDVEKAPFEDDASLYRYLDQTTGTLLWTAAQILGAGPGDEAPLREVARAVAVANWLRALPELEARGKRPLADGRPETLAQMARNALSDLQAQKALSRPAQQALLSGFMARRVLRQAARRPGDVAQNRLHASPLAQSAYLIRARLLGRI